jgi:uncharacterized membrane protein YphA (DoxX/SURF4 family)
MHIFLWALQIALAAKFVSAGVTHAVRPDEAKLVRGRERFGSFARPLLIVIGLSAWLAGACLILPGATGVQAWLTPWAAAVLALMNLLAGGFHLACRESPKIWVSLILCVLAGFVAYGRWAVVPF